MAVHSPRRKLTYEDFLRFPDDGQRHEILDGEHVVSPSPVPRHQQVLIELTFYLRTFLGQKPLGRILIAPMDVLLSDHDVLEPDLLFIAARGAAIVTEKNVQGPPDLVVEILSPSTWHRDLTAKRERYELLGVQEYWVIDAERDTVTVFRREGERFGPPERLAAAAEDCLTTALLPGLEIRLRELFAR